MPSRADLVGSLHFAVQGGSRKSFARVSHGGTLTDEWLAGNTLGAGQNSGGICLTLDGGWI